MDNVELSADFLTNDSSNSCRTCLVTPDTLFKVFDLSFEDVTVAELLNNCVSVKVEANDRLQAICETCIVRLCEIRQFKVLCLNSNSLLQQITRFNLGVIKEENVDLDLDLITVTGGSPDTCSECPSPSNIPNYLKQLLLHTGKVVQLCACCGCHNKVKYHGNLVGIAQKSLEDLESKPNVVTKSTFDEICRTCLTNDEAMKPIFDISFSNIPIRDLLDDCIAVRVEQNDSLPQQICEPCIAKLCGFYAFKQLCFESECIYRIVEQGGDDVEDVKGKDDEDKSNIKHQKESGNERRTCSVCYKSVASQSFWRHKQLHKKNIKLHKCEYCFARFNLLCNWKRHVMTHTGERPHLCDYCGKSFIQANTLIEHKRLHTGEKPYHCTTCGNRWSQYSTYKKHVDKPCSKIVERGINKYECKLCCGIFISKNEMRNHKCEDTSLDCRICDRHFVTRLALKIHITTHSTPKHYTCSFCEETFTMRLQFTRHMKKHKETVHFCNECGKGFANYSGLWSHRKVHSGYQPHNCEICGRSFSQVGSLKSHMLIHSGEKPFSCSVCDKLFTQPNHLKYHMRTHSGEKPYECSYCGKSFSLNGTLTVHMRTHTGETPYVCDVCERGFYDSSSLKRHRFKHSEINIPSTSTVIVQKWSTFKLG